MDLFNGPLKSEDDFENLATSYLNALKFGDCKIIRKHQNYRLFKVIKETQITLIQLTLSEMLWLELITLSETYSTVGTAYWDHG